MYKYKVRCFANNTNGEDYFVNAVYLYRMGVNKKKTKALEEELMAARELLFENGGTSHTYTTETYDPITAKFLWNMLVTHCDFRQPIKAFGHWSPSLDEFEPGVSELDFPCHKDIYVWVRNRNELIRNKYFATKSAAMRKKDIPDDALLHRHLIDLNKPKEIIIPNSFTRETR